MCGNVSAEYKGCSGHKSVCLLENEKEINVGNLFNRKSSVIIVKYKLNFQNCFADDEEGTYFLKTNPGSSKETCYGNDVTSIGLSLVDSLRVSGYYFIYYLSHYLNCYLKTAISVL